MTSTLLIAWGPGELRAAVVDEFGVVDLRIERDQSGSLIGDRFVGRVQKLAPGLDGAFVDIGLDRPGFLPDRRKKAGLFQGQALAVAVVKDARDLKPPELRLCSGQIDGIDTGTVPRRLDPERTTLERLLDSLERTVFERVLVNDAAMLSALRRVLERRQDGSNLECRVEAAGNLLERHGAEEAFAIALEGAVPLKTGGALLIEHTAAATLIDVDLGVAAIDRHAAPQAILAANLAAAHEVARQLRWRNIGGAIVVDFISMPKNAHRDSVVEALKSALATDPVPTEIHGWTRLGHLELTRSRQRICLTDLVLCPQRRVPTPTSLALSALAKICFAPPQPGPIVLTVPDAIGAILAGPLKSYLELASQRAGRQVIVTRRTRWDADSVTIEGV